MAGIGLSLAAVLGPEIGRQPAVAVRGPLVAHRQGQQGSLAVGAALP